MYLIIIGIIFVILSGFVYASANIRSGIYIKTRSVLPFSEEKTVALTFDDGIHPEHTSRVLDILKKHDLRATFFLIGSRAELYPDIVRRMIAEGHQIGNHTYSHKSYFPILSPKKINEELDKTDQVLTAITGKRVIYFRPPFGVTNPTLAKVVKRRNYQTIGWSIRSLDTMEDPIDVTVKRIMDKLHPGAVILLHDDRKNAPELLDELLKRMIEQNYRIVQFTT